MHTDEASALLQTESNLRNPWVRKRLKEFFFYKESRFEVRILDLGSGVGLLSNDLAEEGYKVVGVDLSEECLKVARKHDRTKRVEYLKADVYNLPFEDNSFEVVTCMDLLEHLEEPHKVLKEIERVLKPNGFMVYHTYNKTPLAWFFVKFIPENFIKKFPKGYFNYSRFISPKKLRQWMKVVGIKQVEVHGVRPVIFQKYFWKLLFKGDVDSHFRFTWTSFRSISYCGIARKIPD